MVQSTEARERQSLQGSNPIAPPNPEGSKACIRQYCLAGSAHLGALLMAMVWSWSSTALPSLRESTDTLGIMSKTDEAWIASITFLAGAIGSFTTGYLAQSFGLRMSLIVACIPLLAGWLLIVFAHSVWVILLGRFITGFFVSGVSASGSLMGELAHDSRKGRINFGFDLLFCLGVLAMYIVGTCVAWQAQALACAVLVGLYLVLLIFVVPESPRSLLKPSTLRARQRAEKVLKYVRDSDDVTAELEEIINSMEATAEPSNGVCNFISSSVKSIQKYFTSWEVMKPVFIAIALQFFLQVCGVVPIVCYAVDVFKAAGTEGVHENVSTIVLGVFNLLATCVASMFVDKYGRRPLFIFSEVVLFLTLLVLGVFLMFKDSFGDNAIWNWFPLCCFIIYIIGYSFGVGPLPWVLMGEIFSPNAKGFSNGLVNLAARVFGFFVMFFFNDMNDLIGQHGVYLFFAAVCFSGAIFAYFFVPETKGKTEMEIQAEIKNHCFHHNGNSQPLTNGIPLQTYSAVRAAEDSEP